MLRILGILLVMLSSTLAGVYYANIEAFRIKDLREMKKALIILLSEIEYTLTPLPQAMDNISKRIDEPISKIFSEFSSSLNDKTGQGLGDIWVKILEDNKDLYYFNKEDIDYLKSFGKTLGYLDKSLQINSIAVTIKYMEEKVEELNVSSLKNKKLYQTLGVLAGMLICIVLI